MRERDEKWVSAGEFNGGDATVDDVICCLKSDDVEENVRSGSEGR